MRPDQSITFLQNLGYSVVSFPSSDLKPDQTLLRVQKKQLTRLGDLSTIMTAGGNPLPLISADNLAPSGISGKQTSSVKLNIGLSILGNILKALTGTSLDVSAGFTGNKSVTFAYQNVLEDHVALDQLDQYLSTATVKPGQNSVRQALVDKNVFVLTSTIKSKQITITAQADNDVNGKIDVPVIQQVASGSLSVDVSKANQGEVTFTGPVPIVFGFKAVQIFTDQDAKYTVFKPVADGSVVVRRVGPVTDQDLSLLSLDNEGVFFDVNDAPGENTESQSTTAGQR